MKMTRNVLPSRLGIWRIAKGGALGLSLIAGSAVAQIATNSKVSSPVIVAPHWQMTQGSLTGTQLDGSISSYSVLGTRYWIMSEWNRTGVGGIRHSLTQGGLNQPYATVHWTKETCNRNPATNYCVNGANTMFTSIVPNDVVNLWFVNLYQPQPDDGGLLAFVHEERMAGSGGVEGNAEGRTRIGLAWSSDHGNTWSYLGRIVSPYGDPQPMNIQGLPYVVKDGYFYIYYIDSIDGSAGSIGIGISRASVASVIVAAKTGSLGNGLWQKYRNGGFSTPSLGGEPTVIDPSTMWGVTHTQAAYSSHTGKYYLPLTQMTWSGADSFVKLYESSDAIHWSLSKVVANEGANSLRPSAGYQYCSVVDRDGQLNAQVGQFFHIYCMKDPTIATPSNFAIYRWQVNLGTSVDAFQQSADYDGSQGPYWWYQLGDGSAIADMSWQGSYWVGNDSWTRLYHDAMHPGTAEMPVLKWVAPRAGSVRIEGTVRDADLSCGDGVNASVVHNGTEIFNASVSDGDSVGVSIDQVRTVAAGDGLFFIISPRADNYCDMTRWDPSVTYQ